jgi:hypothetical protein
LSLPPKLRTTTFGFSSFTFVVISWNQLKTSGRVSPVATWPSTPPTDSIAGLPPAARTIAYPGVMTSESPATQIRIFFFGEKAIFAAGFGFAAGFFAGVVGFGPDVVFVGSVVTGGATIATLISSASSRPIASCTSLRGRSRRSAWLTWSRPPVSASATSRFVPGWPLNAALCIPGASRGRRREARARRRRGRALPSRSGGRPRCAAACSRGGAASAPSRVVRAVRRFPRLCRVRV